MGGNGRTESELWTKESTTKISYRLSVELKAYTRASNTLEKIISIPILLPVQPLDRLSLEAIFLNQYKRFEGKKAHYWLNIQSDRLSKRVTETSTRRIWWWWWYSR